MENFFKKNVSLYTNRGVEYEGLDTYLHSNGIEHFVSPPHTPQRVTIVERRHRHIVETTKALLHEASLPSNFGLSLVNMLPI